MEFPPPVFINTPCFWIHHFGLCKLNVQIMLLLTNSGALVVSVLVIVMAALIESREHWEPTMNPACHELILVSAVLAF